MPTVAAGCGCCGDAEVRCADPAVWSHRQPPSVARPLPQNHLRRRRRSRISTLFLPRYIRQATAPRSRRRRRLGRVYRHEACGGSGYRRTDGRCSLRALSITAANSCVNTHKNNLIDWSDLITRVCPRIHVLQRRTQRRGRQCPVR